jgi:cysteine synthase A
MTVSRLAKVLPSIVEAIGRTPIVELSRIPAGGGGRILAKLEYLNPGFSKKDRIARQIVDDAEAAGLLTRGQTIVELTSGNTGTGLAIVCATRGYPFVAVMSRGNSSERARMMAALGAEVVLVDQCPDSTPGKVSGYDLARVEDVARRIARDRRAFRADQFELESNFRAHYLHTAREVLDQTSGAFDAFCDFVGSGGSFAGCAAAFKEHDPAIRCYVVEPEGAAVLAGQHVTNAHHPIQGGGYARSELKFLNHAQIDGYVQITAEEAALGARELARAEGIFAGFSTGANLAAARKLLAGDLAGRTIVILINDSGLKYLSTSLWPAVPR